MLYLYFSLLILADLKTIEWNELGVHVLHNFKCRGEPCKGGYGSNHRFEVSVICKPIGTRY